MRPCPTIQVRPARPEDHAAFVRLFPELGVDDPTPDRARFEHDLLPRMLVATEDETVVGYALYELLDSVGYVRNLVTDPEARRRGIGRALMQELRALFLAGGATTSCLNVKPSNVAAVELYRQSGLEVAYTSWAMRLAMNAPLPERDHAVALAVGPIEPEREAELELQFGLIAGQLAAARRKKDSGGEIDLLVFKVSGRSVGLAVFDPRFPGAFPFRVHELAALPHVLDYFRRRAPPRAQWIQVVVEDDEALHQRLVALGATVALDFVHMRGPL